MADSTIPAPAISAASGDVAAAPEAPITLDLGRDVEPSEPVIADLPSDPPAPRPAAPAGLPAEEREAPAPADARDKEIAALREEIAALHANAAREKAVVAGGLPTSFAKFLRGDESTWAGQVQELASLRGPATAAAPTVPRDPAVDADPSEPDTREQFARALFGLD